MSVQELLASAEAVLLGYRQRGEAARPNDMEAVRQQQAALEATRFSGRERQYADVLARSEAALVALRQREALRAQATVASARERALLMLERDAQEAKEQLERYLATRAQVGPFRRPGQRVVTFENKKIFSPEGLMLYDAWREAKRRAEVLG